MLSKSLIRLSIDGWGCVPSLLFGLRPNYCRGNNINGDLLQKDLLVLLYSVPLTPQQATVDPHLCRRLLDTLTGKSGSVSCGDTAPFSWLLVHTRFYLCPPRVCFPVLWKFCNQIPLASKVKFLGVSQSFARSPSREICCGLSSFHYNVRTSLV